ncbi:hypothetical protein [Isoptericola sp. NPDC057191]|uniref:hypothetical protein n=1 Tax=Isoptericola sp. NPDC057191 TaxID=3346041 RepID=UPI0036431745
MLLAVATVSLAFVPAFHASAAAFWFAGLVVILAAGVIALRGDRRRRTSAAIAAIAIAVVAAVVAVGTVRATYVAAGSVTGAEPFANHPATMTRTLPASAVPSGRSADVAGPVTQEVAAVVGQAAAIRGERSPAGAARC